MGKKKAFTFIEMMVVIIIIGVVVGTGVNSFDTFSQQGSLRLVVRNLTEEIRTTVTRASSVSATIPKRFQVLVLRTDAAGIFEQYQSFEIKQIDAVCELVRERRKVSVGNALYQISLGGTAGTLVMVAENGSYNHEWYHHTGTEEISEIAKSTVCSTTKVAYSNFFSIKAKDKAGGYGASAPTLEIRVDAGGSVEYGPPSV
ncbi:MAG: prepilin-type N-terminal cleavage/methylation domain-containing protein [Alphaproteobacteria bacterium]|nr:prepilin-type N-terminal cleavage/methylation domain-containing protein [Alphaproteobacteria bacterium]